MNLGNTRRRWFRRPWVWATFVAAVVVFAIVTGPGLKRAYMLQSALRRAAESLAKGDIKRAMLDAQFAYNLNQQHVEANRIMAQILEAAGSPAALEWRRRLDTLLPGDTENLIAMAGNSLAAGYPDTAVDVLGRVKTENRNTVAYHDIAARLALTRHEDEVAETHWKEAARLDPKSERFRLNLAILQRKTGDIPARMEALEALRELAAKPDSARAALRALLTDAMARGDASRAKEAAAALASAPGATFQDRLLQLGVLQSLKDPEFSAMLAKLRSEALGKPPELYQLLSWMNSHNLVLLVVDWLRELPQDVLMSLPVCMAVAEARMRTQNWKTLLEETQAGRWGSSEFAQLAYEALAFERLDEHEKSAAQWAQAVAATEQRPERLEALAQLAFAWHWDERALGLLWKVTERGSAPRKVLDTLWEASARARNTEQMRTISKLRMKADPRSIEARNNFAVLSLLTSALRTEGDIHGIAEALAKEAPDNPDVVATHALSLYYRQKPGEALRAMQVLKPDQLQQPNVARYYGVFLSATGRRREAAEYLTLGEKGFILPEEKVLLEQAKAAGAQETTIIR